MNDSRSTVHVYVAGPYTNPDPVDNTRVAIDVGWEIHDLGGFPHIPHLSMFQHFQRSMPLEFWYEYDIELLRICDVMIRIPGASSGADEEARIAVEVLNLDVILWDETGAAQLEAFIDEWKEERGFD